MGVGVSFEEIVEHQRLLVDDIDHIMASAEDMRADYREGYEPELLPVLGDEARFVLQSLTKAGVSVDSSVRTHKQPGAGQKQMIF